ncbi:MAG: domain S-box protein [Mucilaginibacter sp.]|nr:domain S-box protein [Mucilaginibacter sp.]
MALVKKSVVPTVGVSPAGRTIENIPFKKLFGNSQDGLSLLDRNLQTLYRSTSAERINGWNVKDRARYTMASLIHPDDLEIVTALVSNVLANPGFSETCVFRSKHFDGHFIWLESTFTNFLDDPDIQAIVCNFRDVTKKRQDDDLLQQTMKELFAYKYALDEASIVAITDQKGIIKHVNENFCRISKYSAAELIGHDHRIINSGYHDKVFIRNLWVTIARGDIWKGELKNKAKDGSYYWVDTTIIPFLNENGKPYQYVAIRSDITDRKLSQQRIIESEQFIKTITDNLPALIAYWSADLHCLFANKPYMDWFEKQPHEMLGVNKRDLLDKKEFELHELHIQNVLNGKPQSFERTFYKSSGQTIFTQTQYLPDKQDNIVKGFYSLIYDITEIKLAEAGGKQALEERNIILESIDDAFFAVDRNWAVSYWNNMAEKVLLTPKNKILNHNLWEVFADSIGSESYKKYHQAIETNQAVHFEDYYSILAKWYEISAYPAETGLSVYFKDITDRKTAEIQLNELNENLQKHARELAISNAELEQFAYVASHDLQEPLRMVTSFLTQLEKKYGDVIDGKGRQYIHFAVDGAKRMRQIILDLLEYSRVGRTEEDLEEVNFNKLVTEILTLYRGQTEEFNASFDFENLPTFQTYKTPVRQVFQNLIGNSLKYHKVNVDPVIRVACKETKTHFKFSIEDNGIGIAPEYFDKIFIIFQRLHNKDEYSGSGMGLAIAKKIVENLGGKIWIESREGKGSTFHFTLLKK